MNSFSHILIGKLIHTYLDTNYGMTLHKASFLYGNLLPDFTPFYKSQPHAPACWEKHIKNEITWLYEQRQPMKRFGRRYSSRMGVICHFYADFFCYAHTDAYNGGLYPHVLYEWQLYRFMRKNLDELRCTDHSAESAAGAEPARVYSCFERLYRTYLGLSPSLVNDTLYTLRACAEAMMAIAVSSAADWDPMSNGLISGSAEA